MWIIKAGWLPFRLAWIALAVAWHAFVSADAAESSFKILNAQFTGTYTVPFEYANILKIIFDHKLLVVLHSMHVKHLPLASDVLHHHGG